MAITDKNKIVKFNGEKLPQELKDTNQWLAWKVEEKTSKGKREYTKVPYNVNTGYRGNATDPKTWVSYSKAFETLESSQNKYEGLGFVLSENDHYSVLDVDGCFKEKDDHKECVFNDDLDSDLEEFIKWLINNTYCELSPSSTGLHAFFKNNEVIDHESKNNAFGLELYSNKRFMTMTGKNLNDKEILNDESLFKKIVEKYFKKSELISKTQNVDTFIKPSGLTDEEVINRAVRSKNGAKFQDLLEGNIAPYFTENGQSEAVQSILITLAHFTGCDAKQMKRIYENYGTVNRDKWTDKRRRSTWGDDEISTAIKFYTEKQREKELKKKYALTNITELKEQLQLKGDSVRRSLIEEWESNGQRGFKPTYISTLQCANILNDFCEFVVFNEEEDSRLAVYQPNKGIYTVNTLYIAQIIGWLEPKNNKQRTDEVIFYLRRDAKTREKTNQPHLIPVNNGVYNQKTKELEEFTPNYVFTTKIATDYVPYKVAPTIDGWDIDSWLNSIACNDQEIVNLLWQVIADSMNGNYTRKKIIFLTGGGNNGKGTFQELIRELVGSKNVASLKVKEFDSTYAMSQLEGKTCVIGDDNPTNDYVDDGSNIKSVVTGDVVRVEEKYKPAYSEAFKCAVIQSTNDLPRFKDTTQGLYRRLLIVPFDADFNGEIENRHIRDEYIRSKETLQYVLYRALQLEFEKFDTPKRSETALHEYKIENDSVYEFKVEEFDNMNVLKIPKPLLYSLYKEFCEENGYSVKSTKSFSKQFGKLLGKEWETNTTAMCSYSNYEDVLNISERKLMILANTENVEETKKYKVYRHKNYNPQSYNY
ncbi:phage/plasmid primase, P4 family [Staphylococcus kloosii]|uniref:phage/plasmid primase, P4 family n=1 Tax=Staphylococcus kloosii TaxID=29384 RepID=UPI0018A07CE7|nr:phage/plasmid primase, P4 family [Staphylococcus kloosii]MBF7023645.1 DNA primase [Staphylococcus kloosii]